jgi:chaperonin GroES
MPKFRPLQDYVLVKPQARKHSKVLTVIISDSDQNSWGAFGEVMAVGPGKLSKKGKLIPLVSKVGDNVLYGGKGLGCIKFPKVIEDGQEYLILQESDVCFIDERSL